MDLHRFLDGTGGVLALVSLTATVAWGLAATDRHVLGPRSRLVAQAVHRATAVCALGFLLVHVLVKVAEAHATVPAALLPFGSGVLMGLGALAGYLLVLSAATGVLRSAFAGRGRARWWRVLHGCAYGSWCAALVHGLRAGRAPAGWVTASYGLCLAAVAGALLVRLRMRRGPAPVPLRTRPRSAHTRRADTKRAAQRADKGAAQWADADLAARHAGTDRAATLPSGAGHAATLPSGTGRAPRRADVL
ncbi:hypothetical protein [Streptomyces cinnamoneus]|uniref:Ferric oxidoreductase domain-containing protein n=1 Tax=Streptomyces cinnamoneus TaxID=53446 RepID=A0A918WJ35_STRCJ|nr:hypothetical protein [Streptomyces cinnamoneus]GHC51097.1 hypothetical protein GCM10010507_28710 [Streptomyces cinnamoneus]